MPPSIARVMDHLIAPPSKAVEVVALERSCVELILVDLEAGDPIALSTNERLVPYLRAVLAEPKRELWAMHSAGGGAHPMLSKEHAEETAKATVERCYEVAKKNNWPDFHLEMNVIPSHLEPAEHFEALADTLNTENLRLRKLAIDRRDNCAELLHALSALLDENDTTPAATAAKQILDKVTAATA